MGSGLVWSWSARIPATHLLCVECQACVCERVFFNSVQDTRPRRKPSVVETQSEKPVVILEAVRAHTTGDGGICASASNPRPIYTDSETCTKYFSNEFLFSSRTVYSRGGSGSGGGTTAKYSQGLITLGDNRGGLRNTDGDVLTTFHHRR